MDGADGRDALPPSLSIVTAAPSSSSQRVSSASALSSSEASLETQLSRSAQVDARQAELATIVERHDAHVRELFHLDRFVTLIGFDPAVAKTDKSDVFLSFQHDYDLFTNAASESTSGTSRRNTRRALTDRKGVAALLDEEPAPAPPVVKAPAARKRPTDVKGKGKEIVVEVEEPVVAATSKPARRRKSSSAAVAAAESAVIASTPAPRPKKRSSLSNHSASSVASTSHSRPSQSALAAAKRIKYTYGPSIPYTHPAQLPPPTLFNGSLHNFLESYVDLDDEPFERTDQNLDTLAEYEASILTQAADFCAGGRVLFNPDQQPAYELRRSVDHYDNLLDHALYFSKLVSEERKSHILIARKVGRMILQHFDHKLGKEHRSVKEVQRSQKALAKWTIREVRKKWKMAVLVVKSRRKDRAQAESDRIGKIQLNAMLDKSTTMLQAQQVELAGVSDSESHSSDDSSSDDADDDDDDEEDEEDEEDEGTASIAESTSVSAAVNRRHLNRSRSIATPSSAAQSAHDDDNEPVGEDFEVQEDAARIKEDEDWEQEMEKQEEDEDSDSEMGGLAADAEMSIEELMRISGYGQAREEETAAKSKQGTPDSIASGDTPVPSPVAETEEEQEAEEDNEAMSEFGLEADADRDDEDAKLAAEMDANEGRSDDDEMDGLAEDADLPIEELMRKYGMANGDAAAQDDDEEGEQAEAISDDGVHSPVVNGHTLGSDSMDVDPPSAESGDEEEAGSGEDEVEEEAAESEDAISSSEVVVAERPHLRPPFLLRGSLRPYQQAGMEWLAGLYATGVNGILADEMGLGKTIQTISLLAHLACDRGQWGPHLVVVPTSVMLNWEMEFKKFLPGFKILTYYGTQKERKEKRKGWNTENSFHVCVTSYQLVLSDQQAFRRKPWHYMILDEAHHIKNFRSQRWQTLLGFNARHRLLLTGTPLQNNLMELWSLLYFLMPAGLTQDGKGPFADSADFQAWFSNPMEKAIENGEAMDEETKATVSKLHTVLRPYLLRRLKSEVEKQMPGKTESIIYCRLSKRQRFLYDDFMSRSQTKETLGSGHFLSIINCLMQLRKVCNHPDLFEVRPIVTSFAMTKSVAIDYEVKELLVRKRLLMEEPIGRMDWSSLMIVKPDLELTTSSLAAESRILLDAGSRISSIHDLPMDVDLDVQPLRDTTTIAGWKRYLEWSRHRGTIDRFARMAAINTQRCRSSAPRFGRELLHLLQTPSREHVLLPAEVARNPRTTLSSSTILPSLVRSYATRANQLDDIVARFGFVTPKVKAADMPRHALAGLSLSQVQRIEDEASCDILHRASVKLSVAFPDRSLLQYDCGKLQKLDELLRECKAGGHRVLIFTQMTKVLDILEIFLSFHGHRYLRLDGSTKIEQRQIITERFNSNDQILCFISSTRSGGLGINLQGADTVIFYDSDWNPALDRQCQDRAHRIGQTREVRIWRFVTEHSIEENMLKKANQKRRLDEMVIAEGDFTTDYLQKLDWRDYLDDSQRAELGVDGNEDGHDAEGGDGAARGAGGESATEIRNALAAAEDEEDAAAARAAEGELQLDATEFSETQPLLLGVQVGSGANTNARGSMTPTIAGFAADGMIVADSEVVEMAEGAAIGSIDEYMLNFVEENYASFLD